MDKHHLYDINWDNYCIIMLQLHWHTCIHAPWLVTIMHVTCTMFHKGSDGIL